MADATVTWKGAVPYDGFVGQAQHVGAQSAIVDPRSISAGFDIRPFHSENHESALKGAVPYVSSRDGEDADVTSVTVKTKAGAK
jgi:hypothetical protein